MHITNYKKNHISYIHIIEFNCQLKYFFKMRSSIKSQWRHLQNFSILDVLIPEIWIFFEKENHHPHPPKTNKNKQVQALKRCIYRLFWSNVSGNVEVDCCMLFYESTCMYMYVEKHSKRHTFKYDLRFKNIMYQLWENLFLMWCITW